MNIFKGLAACAAFFVCLAITPQNASASDMDYHALDYAEIGSRIEKDAEENHIPGMAVIVVDRENVLFSGTYGDCGSVDTPFIIGSMSKSFTALSIMQLVERGEVNLDAPISDYIDCSPYLKHPSEGEKITVRQLLNHTSGIATNHHFGNAAITDSRGKYEYSNIGYALLGKIIEAVSGNSYEEYVERNIFAPLNMKHSAASLEKSRQNGLIAGYRNYFGIPVAGEPDYPDGTDPSKSSAPFSTVPAGYISSSAADMGKYLQMYMNGGMDIISPDSIEMMFYGSVPTDDSGMNVYGMGWGYCEQYYGQPLFNHSGLVENYTSNMFIIPEKEIGIVILVNMNDYFVGNYLLDNTVLPLLGGEKAALPAHAYTLFHILIDLIYLLIVFLAVYPVISLGRWKRKPVSKGLILDILRHGVFPALLIALPYILGVPMWLVRFFVKDLFIVLTGSSALLFITGIYKIFYRLVQFRKAKAEGQ